MEAARVRRNSVQLPIELDSKRIESIAQKSANANYAFARYIKTLDLEMVETVVEKIAAEVTAAVDCTACAKCCRALTIAPDYRDVSQLAATTDMTTQDFKRKYMRIDSEGDLVFKQRPCPFLKASKCSVYGGRPQVCRKYPYLDQRSFVSEINRVLRNVSVCPIVFNTFERVKRHFESSQAE